MPISEFEFSNLGPIKKATFEFDDHVNCFIGPNNSGKSTTLFALADIVLYPFVIPPKLFTGKTPTWSIVIRNKKRKRKFSYSGSFPINMGDKNKGNMIGNILRQIGFSVIIPAIRLGTDFRSGGPKDLGVKGNLEVDENVWNDITVKELEKRDKLIEPLSSSIEDQDIIQRLIELDYRAYRHKNKEILNAIEIMSAMASEITEGYPVRYIKIDEDSEGLFPLFDTPDGELPLNCLSQGTQSVVQWLTHLVMAYGEYYDFEKGFLDSPAVAFIDEIDAHMHPAWQRRIIPTLTKYLPNLQIFFSTHSPLMLTGLREGQIHLFDRNKKGDIAISRNTEDISGWSADEILHSFMSLKSPTDLKTADQLKRLGELRNRSKLTKKEKIELEKLREFTHEAMISGPTGKGLKETEDFLADLVRDEKRNSLKRKISQKKSISR